MQISAAAAQSGVPPKTIRYYESIGLITRPARTRAGYRDYDERAVHELRFVRRARALGFTIIDAAQLLALYRERRRASADVKAVAAEHVTRIGEKIAELESMRRTLRLLMARCHGDARPECPILDDLATTPVARKRSR